MAKYKKSGSVTLFDAQNTKENLSELGIASGAQQNGEYLGSRQGLSDL